MKHELRRILEKYGSTNLNVETTRKFYIELEELCDSLPDEPLTGSGCVLGGKVAGSTSDLTYAKLNTAHEMLVNGFGERVKTTSDAMNLANLVNATYAAIISQDMGEVSDGYHTFNELYAHRVRLFSTLMCAFPDLAWWSHQHHDGSKMEGWILAGIDTPNGPVTYHLPVSEIGMLPIGTELERGKEWDGHTAADVLERLKSL